jgi:hypothetical protein
MKMFKCDGCGTVADYEDGNVPKGFDEVVVRIESGGGGFTGHYDLCAACEKRLRKDIRVHEWVQEAPEKRT